MEIKRIQLRGISRAPSDRITENGGVAESLNVVLDHTECAPVVKPKDVTSELGLPNNLVAEKVYVHKAANYENTIVLSDNSLLIYTQTGSLISSFSTTGGKVKDVISIGNTVIVLMEDSVQYLLYRNNAYVDLGKNIPFPKMEIQGQNEGLKKTITLDLEALNLYGLYRAFGEEYSKYTYAGLNSDEGVLTILSELEKQKAVLAGEAGVDGVLYGPSFVMYGVTMYDGSIITTTPELLSGSSGSLGERTWSATLLSRYEDKSGNKEFWGGIEATIKSSAYYLSAKLKEPYAIKDWRDVICSIDVYVTNPIDLAPEYRRIEIVSVTDDDSKGTRTAATNWGVSDVRNQLLGEGVFYKVKSFDLSNYEDEITNLVWNSSGTDLSSTTLATSYESIPSSNTEQAYVDMRNITAVNGLVYNNTLVLSGVREIFEYNGKAVFYPVSSQLTYTGRFKFYLPGGGVVYSEPEQPLNFEAILTYASMGATGVDVLVTKRRKVYLDQEATDYEIETTYSYIKLPMQPHPSILCSYAYWGLGKNLGELAFETNGTLTEQAAKKKVDFSLPENPYADTANKVFTSAAENPFVFPEGAKYTFQSKVTGMAIAAKALSQGQFGQFPLYVFTEDGIWVMETAADGSFVTSKPLSRDTCVNPDSITPIDNAVVFASDKGLMLLSGSEVVNLSSYMHGRHCKVGADARLLIEGQPGYEGFINTLKDETSFLEFLRKAKIAYDYAGNRLICIAADEEYQYIYKLDTKTWHKTKHEADLVDVINSYPECLVMANASVSKKHLWVTNNATQEEPEYIGDRIKVVIPDLRDEDLDLFLSQDGPIDVTDLRDEDLAWLINEMRYYNLTTEVRDWQSDEITRVYDLTTYLDAAGQETEKAVITTRPFDLEYPDTYKSISDIRVRGQYKKGAVKFILEASNDNENFHVIRTVRGQSWKYFRVTILADLEQHDRLSWIDVKFETRLTDKLR